MSWAQRRKATYIFSVLFIIAIIFIIVLFSFFNKAPTCSDGILNQGEAGVDCSGPCSVLCRADYVNPTVVWGPRWAKVTSNGTYSFVIYLQNPNTGVGAIKVPYLLKVYDKDDILLYQSPNNSYAYVPPNTIFVVYLDNINLNDKIPARAKFDFTQTPVWQKINSNELNINTVSKSLMNEDTRPKLLATIKNSSLRLIENIESVAILYDEDGNAIAFSKTKIDFIDKDSTTDIVFTWPEKFDKKVVRIDIVSKVLNSF